MGRMQRRTRAITAALALCVSLFAAPVTAGAQAPVAPPAAAAPLAPGVPGRPDKFAGQKRIHALVITGGCCHDYGAETAALMQMAPDLPIDWTVQNLGGAAQSFVPELFKNANWYRGYDIVVHNECWTPPDDQVSEAYLSNITAATKAGIPAIVIHCAMHTFRSETGDKWRTFLGVRSVRHGPAHPFEVKIVAPAHQAMAGIPAVWMTPVEELYVIDRTYGNTQALATAVDTDGKVYPIVWAHDSTGARVWGTTLGHKEAWGDPIYKQMLTQGFRWALGR